MELPTETAVPEERLPLGPAKAFLILLAFFGAQLFTGFSRSWSALVGGSLVTLLFLASHLTEVWGYAPAMLSIAAVGTAAVFARILTKSLLPAVALHTAYNLVLTVSIYAGRA